MFSNDYPLLNTPHLVALILRQASDDGVTATTCASRLAALMDRTGEHPQVEEDFVVARIATHIGYLREARLLKPGEGERYVLTERGRGALDAHPNGMDIADLTRYPEFAAYLRSREDGDRAAGRMDPRPSGYDEGYGARRAGTPFTANPYTFNTVDHLAWENGWCEALDEEVGPTGSPITGSERDSN